MVLFTLKLKLNRVLLRPAERDFGGRREVKMPGKYPGPNDIYPGKSSDGKYCRGCGWPITPDGDCNCGWNHRTKRSAFNEHCHIFLNQKVALVDPVPPAKKNPDKDNNE